MKILQINSVCGYGSTGNIVVDLYRALEEQGNECCVAYGRKSAPENVKSYRIGSDLDVYLHGILSRLTDRHGFYSTKATQNFVQWMRKYNPDLVHLHNLHGYYINIDVLFKALKELDKPVIWTLHDCWSFTGHCSHFEYIGCEKWKKECYHCPQKRDYPASLLFDHSQSNYNKKKHVICALKKLTIVTPSIWLKNLVDSSFLKKYPSYVIHNGIDLNIFQPMCKNVKERYGLSDKKVILGVASEWGISKGFRDFMQLADVLGDTYQVVLIGHMNGKVPKKNNVTYISRTSNREELAAWYTEADFFLNPTYQDTYPTVNMEAQACGTPVITYNTGGSPEGVIKNCGEIFAQGDIHGVAEYIQHNQQAWTIKGAEKFSKEIMLDNYINLFNSYRD